MKKIFKELISTIEKNSINNKAEITNVKLWVKRWKQEFKKAEILNNYNIKSNWINPTKTPKTTDCVAVIVDTCKYPTIGWYSKHNGEWVLEDKDIKGYVIAWYPLPNYQTFKKYKDGN